MAQQADITVRILSASNLLGLNIDGTSNVFFTVDVGRGKMDKTKVVEETTNPKFDDPTPMRFTTTIPTIATIKAFNQVPFSETLTDLLGVATLSFLMPEPMQTKTVPLTHGGDVTLAGRAVGGCGTLQVEYSVAAIANNSSPVAPPNAPPVTAAAAPAAPSLTSATAPAPAATVQSAITEHKPPLTEVPSSATSNSTTEQPKPSQVEPPQPPIAHPAAVPLPPTQDVAAAPSQPQAPPTHPPPEHKVESTPKPTVTSSTAAPALHPAAVEPLGVPTIARPGPLPAAQNVTFAVEKPPSQQQASAGGKASPPKPKSASTAAKPSAAAAPTRSTSATKHRNPSALGKPSATHHKVGGHVTETSTTASVMLKAAQTGSTKEFVAYRASDPLLKGELLQLRDYAGRSVLHIAAWHGQLNVLHELTKPLGSTNIPVIDWAKHVTRNGNTVLHCAAEAGRAEVVQYLLQQRSAHTQSSVRNARGETPTDAALWYRQPATAELLNRFNSSELRAVPL